MPADRAPRRRRAPGPPPPISVRSRGEPALAAMLERAVAASGRPRRATHGFHAYPAGMNPDAARTLLEAFPEGGVHDPFCGGGTVLVEARLAGRPASGTDLSPIAVLVSRARTSGPELATPLRSAARRLAARARAPGEAEVPEAVRAWYEPHVARELARLRDGIREVEDAAVRDLLWAVFSAIAVKASFRESDTSPRRVPVHRPPGTTAVLFHKKARELGRMLEEMPPGGPARVERADARRAGPPEGTGLVLTSPPYPGVYDYVPMQGLRMAWMGIEAPDALAREIGARREFRAKGRGEAFRRWRADTARWIERQARGLRPGGWLVVVVGDGLVGGRTVDALSSTVEALRAAGLEVVARASADRPDPRPDAGVRTEHLVAARRR